MAHRLSGGILCDHLRCVGSAFTRPLKADFTGARPPNHIAFHVGDRHDCVVERGKHMRDTRMIFLLPLALTTFGFSTSAESERFSELAAAAGAGCSFFCLPPFWQLGRRVRL